MAYDEITLEYNLNWPYSIITDKQQTTRVLITAQPWGFRFRMLTDLDLSGSVVFNRFLWLASKCKRNMEYSAILPKECMNLQFDLDI